MSREFRNGGITTTASGIQQMFNNHRAICRQCFAHCISSKGAAEKLCEYGQGLQRNYLALYELEKPKA